MTTSDLVVDLGSPSSGSSGSSGRFTPKQLSATELLGTLARVSQAWENEDGTLTVLASLASGETVRGIAQSQGELLPGGHYRFLGRWSEHYRWGWQFAFDSFLRDVPAGGDALIAYIVRSCNGIGQAKGSRLLDLYGEDVVRVLIEEPGRAVADGILSELVAKNAAKRLRGLCDPALREAHLDLFRLFKGHGFYGKAIGVCLRLWRERASQIVRRDPFVLITNEIPGCGFSRCDRLYQTLHLNPDRLKRQGLAAWHALRTRDGDTWLSLSDGLDAIRRQIGGCDPQERRATALMVRGRWLTYRMTGDSTGGISGNWIAERGKAASERDVALRLRELMRGQSEWPTVGVADLGEDGQHQADELAKALTARVAILTGSPGTGKTFAATAVIRAALKKWGYGAVAVAAPTGKAAVRIAEKMVDAGLRLQATTIHRLLKVKLSGASGWSFEFGADNPLPYRCVVLDEVSMVDVDLAASFLRACGVGTHLLLVGDKHQLPPVGHGAFLRDVIDSGIPCARLTEIRRNAGRIVHTCAAVKGGSVPQLPHDLEVFTADSKENLVHLPLGRDEVQGDRLQALDLKLSSLYGWLGQQQKWDLVDQVQVIVARNLTRKALNRQLQTRLNPPDGSRGLGIFRPKDKVICLRNGFFAKADTTGRAQQEYVANGDIGRVEGFRGRQMLVRLKGPDRLVAVPIGKGAAETVEGEEPTPQEQEDGTPATGCAWDLAYAVTCHKYQGSECPVAIVLVEGAGKLGSREWIYTALSRARELCVVIGERSELTRYAKNETLPDRKTFLAEMLRGEVEP